MSLWDSESKIARDAARVCEHGVLIGHRCADCMGVKFAADAAIPEWMRCVHGIPTGRICSKCPGDTATIRPGPVSEQTQPVKHSSSKPKLSLAMGPGFVQVGRAMTFGATKYSPHNYSLGEGLPRLELVDAALRHIADYLNGLDVEPESGLHPLAHAGASLLMALDLIERGKGADGRYAREGT